MACLPLPAAKLQGFATMPKMVMSEWACARLTLIQHRAAVSFRPTDERWYLFFFRLAVLEGFCQVFGLDVRLASEVGNRPGELQNAMVTAGSQFQLAHGSLHQGFPIRRDLAIGADLFGGHIRVRGQLRSSEPGQLPLPGCFHSHPDLAGRLTCSLTAELLVIYTRHLQMNVNPVE